jgi:hypothetical protein
MTIHVQEDRGTINSYYLKTKDNKLKIDKITPDNLSKSARRLLKSSGTLLRRYHLRVLCTAPPL